MKTITIIAAITLIATPAIARTVTVKPHFTKQGTYKPTSFRTSPNATKIDNFSSKGNFNPYTGKAGMIDPYRIPAPSGH